jgi:hypothetical protein
MILLGSYPWLVADCSAASPVSNAADEAQCVPMAEANRPRNPPATIGVRESDGKVYRTPAFPEPVAPVCPAEPKRVAYRLPPPTPADYAATVGSLPSSVPDYLIGRPTCLSHPLPDTPIVGVVDSVGRDGIVDIGFSNDAALILLAPHGQPTHIEKWWLDSPVPRCGDYPVAIDARELVASTDDGRRFALGDGARQEIRDFPPPPSTAQTCEPGATTLALSGGCLTTHMRWPPHGWDFELMQSFLFPAPFHEHSGYVHPRGGDVHDGYDVIIADRVSDPHAHLVQYYRTRVLRWDIALPLAFQDGPYILRNGDILVNASAPVRFTHDGCPVDVTGLPAGRVIPLPDGEIVVDGATVYLVDDVGGEGGWARSFPDDVVILAATSHVLVGERGGDGWIAFLDDDGNLLCNPP